MITKVLTPEQALTAGRLRRRNKRILPVLGTNTGRKFSILSGWHISSAPLKVLL
jgi:hypothetical protein